MEASLAERALVGSKNLANELTFAALRTMRPRPAVRAEPSCRRCTALTDAPIVSLVYYWRHMPRGFAPYRSVAERTGRPRTGQRTAYVSYRKDRVTYAKGASFLEDVTLEQNPKTRRVVASCCNSAILMRFDDARHWAPVYSTRFGPNGPTVQMRICTSFLPKNVNVGVILS